MVLDLRAFDLSIRDEFVLIRSRFSRDVRPFALEFSPSLVWASLIEFPPRLITSGNSDGGLPFDGQVLDSRREELCDVDQKYENPAPLIARQLTSSSKNMTRALLGRRKTSKPATS